MWGRGDAGAGHAREALAARLKMRDAGWLGDCLVAAVDCIDAQGIKSETLDARSWRRRSQGRGIKVELSAEGFVSSMVFGG